MNISERVIYDPLIPKIFNLSKFQNLYYIYLNIFFWEGVCGTDQTLKGVEGT